MSTYPTFDSVCKHYATMFQTAAAYKIKSEKWQGLDTTGKPELEMREILFPTFLVPLRGLEDLQHWQGDIKPNLPFADVHFLERVSGEPSNPGDAWKIWPWGNAADKHRVAQGRFTHTYQERFWPKYAGMTPIGEAPLKPEGGSYRGAVRAHSGIRYPYGDLNDVVELLHREPLTRQAYLPVWFPEDTGVLHGGRVPCTLGYQFINRHDYFHVSYGIRSCDFVRHFRDDCYFAVRLTLWILDQLRRKDKRWNSVKPGMFRMEIGSFHIFVNDLATLKKGNA